MGKRREGCDEAEGSMIGYGQYRFFPGARNPKNLQCVGPRSKRQVIARSVVMHGICLEGVKPLTALSCCVVAVLLLDSVDACAELGLLGESVTLLIATVPVSPLWPNTSATPPTATTHNDNNTRVYLA